MFLFRVRDNTDSDGPMDECVLCRALREFI